MIRSHSVILSVTVRLMLDPLETFVYWQPLLLVVQDPFERPFLASLVSLHTRTPNGILLPISIAQLLPLKNLLTQ
jgi:hypothetical protein